MAGEPVALECLSGHRTATALIELQQVTLNLMVNAVEAMADHGDEAVLMKGRREASATTKMSQASGG